MLAARFCCAIALSGWLASTPAWAAEPSAEARRWYTEGKAEYAQGHYVDAIGLFQRSYALFESSALLFNMAQAHRLAGPEHCANALSLYKSYLSSEPDAENKKEVEERIEQLADCSPKNSNETAPILPAYSPAPALKPAPTLRARPREQTPLKVKSVALPTGPVLVTGTGAALLVAGGVLYVRAWDKHREAKRVCPCYPGTYSNWEVLSNVSYALLAVGGATLAGGATWWIFGEPSRAGAPAQAMLGVSGKF